MNWNRLLDAAAQPGGPTNCYYDWVSNPCERSLYVARDGRSLVKISPLPWGALQAPDPALWSPSVSISGLQSKSTPSVALFQSSLHMVRNDPHTNALVWTTSPDGLNWSPDQPLGPRSQTGASIAAFGAVLHMVYLEDASHSIRWWTFDGSTWTDKGYIPDLSIVPPNPPQNLSSQTVPALVPFGGLVMVGADLATTELYMLWFDGSAWKAKRGIFGQFSTRPPKLAVFQSKIHMVYLGDSSNHVCWSVFEGSLPGGAWWSRTRIRCQKSQSAPALAVHKGLLQMVHRGDGSNSLWWSLYDGDEWTPNVTILGQNSQTSVALCETPDQSKLVMLRLSEASNDLWFSAV